MAASSKSVRLVERGCSSRFGLMSTAISDKTLALHEENVPDMAAVLAVEFIGRQHQIDTDK